MFNEDDEDDEHHRGPPRGPPGAGNIAERFCVPEKFFYILAVALMWVIFNLYPQLWLLTTVTDTAILRPLCFQLSELWRRFTQRK